MRKENSFAFYVSGKSVARSHRGCSVIDGVRDTGRCVMILLGTVFFLQSESNFMRWPMKIARSLCTCFCWFFLCNQPAAEAVEARNSVALCCVVEKCNQGPGSVNPNLNGFAAQSVRLVIRIDLWNCSSGFGVVVLQISETKNAVEPVH